MFSAILYWLLELCFLSRRAWPVPYMNGDGFEKLVNGTPIMQGRVVAAMKQCDDQVLTIEWDDGTRTTGSPEDLLRSAREIHPLAPRLDRSARHR